MESAWKRVAMRAIHSITVLKEATQCFLWSTPMHLSQLCSCPFYARRKRHGIVINLKFDVCANVNMWPLNTMVVCWGQSHESICTWNLFRPKHAQGSSHPHPSGRFSIYRYHLICSIRVFNLFYSILICCNSVRETISHAMMEGWNEM